MSLQTIISVVSFVLFAFIAMWAFRLNDRLAREEDEVYMQRLRNGDDEQEEEENEREYTWFEVHSAHIFMVFLSLMFGAMIWTTVCIGDDVRQERKEMGIVPTKEVSIEGQRVVKETMKMVIHQQIIHSQLNRQ